MCRDDGQAVAADPPTTVRGLTKKSNGLRNWILIRSSGHEIILDVDKYAIMHRVHIHPRDLRILDPVFSYPSAILSRERAIVLNLEHIKAIITSEEVWLRDPSDENVIPIVEALRRRFEQVYGRKELAVLNEVDADDENDSPFEFQALEVALEAICSHLSARTTELETEVYPTLDKLTSKIGTRNLDRIRRLKSQMTRLIARIQRVRDELEQLLDNEDDMAELYLSRKLADALSVREDQNDVEKLEMLLEVYFEHIDGTFNRLATLREYIDNTEDYINIQLDNHRNKLIKLELFVNTGILCSSVHALASGIGGMYIPFAWNDQSYAYTLKWVVIALTLFCGVMFVLIISYARHKGLARS